MKGIRVIKEILEIKEIKGNFVGSDIVLFSTGVIISGATVIPATPLLTVFGTSIVQIIDLDGESISPSETVSVGDRVKMRIRIALELELSTADIM
nr:hypothetical protein [Megavirus caiporensis]